jgi:hypothetical protein
MSARSAGIERNVLSTVAAAGLLLFALYFARDALGGRAYLERNALNWNVWYCGGQAVAEHRDPYRVEPLRACEHRVEKLFHRPWALTPMPLPGYSLALLWPFLALPYFAGKAVWIAVVLGALGVSAWASAALTKLPFTAVLLVFLPTIGILNIIYGGPEPLGIAALCLAALALERNRPALAGVLAALALIEPHVGAPAVIAAFVLVPRARVAIAVAAGVLALATVAVLGWQTVVEYVRVVLPAQGSGEAVLSFYQYSLAHVLYLIGVPAAIASALGSLSYLATIAFGIFAAARIRERYGRDGAIVLVPVALSLFGGLYVHNHQISAALPGALLLATLPTRYRVLAVAAVALLAFPWSFDTRLQEGVAALAVIASIVMLLPELALRPRLALAVLAPLAFAGAFWFDGKLTHASTALPAHPETIAAGDMASSAWTKLLLWTPGAAVDDASTLLVKLPWWIALGSLTFVAAAAALQFPGVASRKNAAGP